MRAPVPPFSEETPARGCRRQRTRGTRVTRNAWPAPYTVDSGWRNRDEFLTGRREIVAFPRRKWERELDHALRKHLGRHGQPDRRALSVRESGRGRPVVAQLRQ